MKVHYMSAFFLCSILLLYGLINCVGCEELTKERWSFVGIDMNGRHARIEFSDIGALIDAGIYSFGAEKLFWMDVEKSPESGYDWSYPDTIIQKIERVDGDVSFTLYNVSSWATEIPNRINPASATKPEYRDRYTNYVKAFAERYDKDGKDDMPGLKYPHNYFQIEDEQAMSGWIGTRDCVRLSNTGDNNEVQRCLAKAYGEHLRVAYNAIKSANANAKITTIAFNPGDFFDVNPSSINIPIRGRLLFLDILIKQYKDYFDFLGFNFNYDYIGIYRTINFFRSKWGSYNVKYIIADAGTMPHLGRRQFLKEERYMKRYPHKRDLDILAVLDEGRRNKEYREMKQWWEAEKAKLSFKKAVVAAGSGAEQIYFQFGYAKGAPGNAWSHSGILSLGLKKENDGKKGTPRAVVFALKQLNERIKSFKEVKNINPLSPAYNPMKWIWVYSYSGKNGTTGYVLWSSGGKQVIDLGRYVPEISEKVKVTPIVTHLDEGLKPIYPLPKVTSASVVIADDTPVFIEKTVGEKG